MWSPESVQAQLAGNGRFPQVKKLPEGRGGGGGVILGILGRAVPTGSPNPGPISDL